MYQRSHLALGAVAVPLDYDRVWTRLIYLVYRFAKAANASDRSISISTKNGASRYSLGEVCTQRETTPHPSSPVFIPGPKALYPLPENRRRCWYHINLYKLSSPSLLPWRGLASKSRQGVCASGGKLLLVQGAPSPLSQQALQFQW